jgi:hypothetical protein
MSRLIFDKKDRGPLKYVDESEWTTDRLKDEFFLCLAKAPDNKYYEEAKILMYKIPLTPQYPQSELEAIPFFISFADLSSRVQSEFKQFCVINNKKRVGLFLKEVVIGLFENLDYEYAHMSVLRKLRIKVVKSQ